MDPQFKQRLVPDELWTLVEALIPPAPVRPQGGGRRRIGPRDILIAIVYVLMADVSWRSLPGTFGVSTPTAYRRYLEWHGSGMWTSLLDATEQHEGDNAAWMRAIARAALNRRPVLPTSGGQPAGCR
jgi:transposase